MKAATRIALLTALFACAYGAAVNSHQHQADTLEDAPTDIESPVEVVANLKSKSFDIVRRAARDLFQTFVDEKAKTSASWVDLLNKAKPEIQGRALNPLGNVGLNIALGVGGVLLGFAALNYGSATVARSLKSSYDTIEWRSVYGAMTRDDFLERTFDWMDVKDVACKKRMVCEVEQFAADQSTFKTLLLKFLSKRHPGLQAYSDAVDTGLDYQDCAQIFSECPMNAVQLLGNTPLDRLGINSDFVAGLPWAKIAENINVIRNLV